MSLINRFNRFILNKTSGALLLILIFSIVRSPGQFVTSFSINPPVLNDTTSFDIYVTSSFPSGTCDLHTQSYTVMGSVIEAQANHCIGLTGSTCTTTDTFHILPLVAGTYIFSLDLNYSTDSTNCIGISGDTSYLSSITVLPLVTKVESDIESIDYFLQGKSLYIAGNYAGDNNSITVFNFSGLDVFNKKLYGTEDVDLSELSDGIYFCCLFVNQKQYFIKFFLHN